MKAICLCFGWKHAETEELQEVMWCEGRHDRVLPYTSTASCFSLRYMPTLPLSGIGYVPPETVQAVCMARQIYGFPCPSWRVLALW